RSTQPTSSAASDVYKRQEKEFERNHERYQFLKWAQQAFDNFEVVPPETGIIHQVNLEYLSDVILKNDENLLFPDSLEGTDSHTTTVSYTHL
ncbi:hypothetical protein KQJ29_29800, partial [Enterococcus sp. S181_ASV_20]|nr:hypothetical protein [Enterococcus sp. S181_ASV_20]